MPFVRRSGRINPNYNAPSPNQMGNPMFFGMSPQPNRPQFEKKTEEKEKPQRYFNNPEIQNESEDNGNQKVEQDPPEEPQPEIVECNEEKNEPPSNVSATTKAIQKMETDDGEKKKFKKTTKAPLAVKRKRLNQRLSKILAPKSALILLHELKPGCIYKVQEQHGLTPAVFSAQVEIGGVILGSGQGNSKSQAKNSAAENAIKTLVSKSMSQNITPKKEVENRENADEEMEEDVKNEDEDGFDNLPWAGLASFAMYKLFTEWQGQGTDLKLPRPGMKTKTKTNVKSPVVKKDLPPNASELHPAVLLNIMRPGLTAVEVAREDVPKYKVTMGYSIDGEMYKGVGGNKKDAKKEAAKVVLSSLYGVQYPA